jgi:Mrp family chromosome partitioning ATPase
MGRVLDFLSHARPHRSAWTAPRPVVPVVAEPEPALDEPPLTPLPEAVAEMPFVEVGGPRAPVTAVAPLPRAVPATPTPGIFSIVFQPLTLDLHGLRTVDERFAPELVAFHQPDHAVAGQYRALADELTQQLMGPASRLVLFTGSTTQAGTTTVVLNVAIALAQQPGVRVCVVDANLAQPALGRKLGLPHALGLSDVLQRRTPLNWALQATGQADLTALTGGRATSGPDLTNLPPVLETLRQRYDWVLLDAAPWGYRPELSLLTGISDATYLVLRQADLDAPELGDLQAAVLQQGGRLRGYVLTQ